MNILQKIEEYTISKNDSKRQIAEFIIDNKTTIYRFSMDDIAAQTFSSKSALVRFGKSLGFHGWKDFLGALTEQIHYENTHYSHIDPNIPFNEGDDVQTIIQNMATIQIEAIQDTADQLDDNLIQQAVKQLVYAQRIVIFGMNPNNLIAELFRRKMASIGRIVEVVAIGESGIIASSLKSQDVALLISYSGNDGGRDPLQLIPLLQRKRVSLIGITSAGDNYMRQMIPLTFTISSRERLYKKISNFSTEESILFLLNVLFATYFAQNYRKNFTYKLNNSIALEEARRIKQVYIKE
ncbi:MAG: MurR/RpiR family transcriptional regulator [Culicoidibacterales bacterium]